MDGRPALTDPGVSAREAEVLAALGEHLTNAEIGARLFISIRTVESHVSSLLRKLQVSDRRALAALAAGRRPVAGPAVGVAGPVAAVTGALPLPLTPFVGRATERAALADALTTHRLVTAVGPGGVGKTRLALTLAADLSERFADGSWYVDLVPVTDPAMVAGAIAAALGVGEQQGRSADDTMLAWLSARETLLVLDNCEHLRDGVAVLLERLLAGSPRLVVLATSRARLLLPFERVFDVPGLSVQGRSAGDAVELFVGRAAASGAVLTEADRPRVAAVCRALDGMALAIELAAARLPSLGLSGLEAGLADGLRLLTGGPRVDDRHRSLRSTLDWSYGLLTSPEQAMLRRVAVFATPFTADAAAAVLGDWPPPARGEVGSVLAGLADQSLLVAAPDPSATRYRALETIRQYGVERLGESGEAGEARVRHLAWCLAAADSLPLPPGDDLAGWRLAFDEAADELRAALNWAAGQDDRRDQAYRLALRLADLCFARGLTGESQRRYEQAAALAGADQDAAAAALRLAAGAAATRHFGTDALRLYRAAAELAIRTGDRASAAMTLAWVAELIARAPGLMASLPDVAEAVPLLRRAWALAGDDPRAQASVLAAEAFQGQELDPVTAELAERAITLARRASDPLIESSALDQLTGIQLARGEMREAAGSVQRRVELLASIPVTALTGMETADTFSMGADCAIGVGDLRAALRFAVKGWDLPFHREEAHLATSRLILVHALTGEWDEALALADRFREGWELAGSPRAGNLSRAPYAAATVHGMRGDDGARADWLQIVAALATPGRPLKYMHFDQFFDAWLLLHRGEIDQAMHQLRTPPEQFRNWFNGLWRPWYAALWAEAAVLAGHPDAAERIQRARPLTVDNPIAAAVVRRATCLHAGHHDGLAAVATALQSAGCRYEWARTLIIMGGPDRRVGETALASMGATPMSWDAD